LADLLWGKAADQRRLLLIHQLLADHIDSMLDGQRRCLGAAGRWQQMMLAAVAALRGLQRSARRGVAERGKEGI